MSSLLEEYTNILAEIRRLDLGDDEPLPPDLAARLDTLCRQFDCQCCGLTSPGKWSIDPDCHCDLFMKCKTCNRCLQCCGCMSRGERLNLLRAQRDRYNHLIKQANKLAVGLGLDELSDEWNTDDLADLEKRLKAQWMAVKRLARRFYQWEEVAIELGNLGAPEMQEGDCEYLNPPLVEDSDNIS